ncbi:M16 family metallopeptidase [Galbibacter mesophilus]|uniref:M16 family metallopeptidase n=1 Tax=Galbibacter mesophilus TaxID=379069 RepID=UPI00191CD7B3|nr:insulinase family protein [Galbibacter mesophilus]MCM5662750.1 insulinase family protein [Galbibacter mesophilus]
MKNYFCMLLALCLFIGTAQQSKETFNDLQNKIPFDSSVKKGTLDNGLTYYVKKNKKPSAKAELRLVINAGSILEDPDQLGLAHLIEHMAFNGTKSFKKNKLIDYLQSIGVSFGADLNAHTSFDETVYKLTVPTDNKEYFKTSIKILREWADGISFDPEEIDKERGVVAEELRARNTANARLYDQTIGAMTNNSRYADRLPIGTLDVILNSEYESVTNFYNDWYRPDLMAVIIVGDVNLDETEKMIKKQFGSLKSFHKKPRQRTKFSIPNNTKPVVKIATDIEARNVNISLYYKKNSQVQTTLKDYKNSIVRSLFSGMLKARLSEAELEIDTPILSSTAGLGNFLADKESLYIRSVLKEEQIEEGVSTLLSINENIKQHGFTISELNRYKEYLLNNALLFEKEQGKIPSKYYVEKLIDNFTYNDPFPGESFRYNFYKQFLPSITLAEVNALAKKWITNDGLTVIVKAPEKKNVAIPSEEKIKTLISETKSRNLEPYVDNLADKKIEVTINEEGSIVNKDYNKKIDVTTWELSNGVKVIAKPTMLQNDLISLHGYRPGGSSLAPDSIYVSARNAGSIIGSSGMLDISGLELEKLTMGKTVSITPYINFYEELFSGSSTAEELELMLTMLHLYFTNPNKDIKQFEAEKQRMIANTKNDTLSPDAIFDNEISKIMTNNHLRGTPITVNQLQEELDLDTAFDFYKKRFSSANGFTFIFVGSFDIEKLKTLSKKYLATLPTDRNSIKEWRDINLRRVNGIHKNTVKKGKENKAKVDLRFTGTLDYTLDRGLTVSLLGDLLRIKLTEELRENMSGVYGVQVSGFATDAPYDWYRMHVRFTCSPENKDALIEKVHDVINNIKENGASEKDVKKIVETRINRAKDGLKYNQYWSSKLKSATIYNWNPEEILDPKRGLEKVNSAYFKKAANTYFDNENYVETILLPEDLGNKKELK